jgi:hypothetical protein
MAAFLTHADTIVKEHKARDIPALDDAAPFLQISKATPLL